MKARRGLWAGCARMCGKKRFVAKSLIGRDVLNQEFAGIGNNIPVSREGKCGVLHNFAAEFIG